MNRFLSILAGLAFLVIPFSASYAEVKIDHLESPELGGVTEKLTREIRPNSQTRGGPITLFQQSVLQRR